MCLEHGSRQCTDNMLIWDGWGGKSVPRRKLGSIRRWIHGISRIRRLHFCGTFLLRRCGGLVRQHLNIYIYIYGIFYDVSIQGIFLIFLLVKYGKTNISITHVYLYVYGYIWKTNIARDHSKHPTISIFPHFFFDLL